MQETLETQVLSLSWEDTAGEGNGNPLPVFLPRKSYEQGNLVSYSPQGCKEADTTEAT